MEEHELDAKLKSVRRDFSREVANLEEAFGLFAKTLRNKAHNDDLEQIALKLGAVESDTRDSIKSMRSDLQDMRHTFGRSMDGLISSINALSESMATFRRESDGRTTDTVNRLLSERRGIGPIGAATGAGGLVTAILTALYMSGVIPHAAG